MAVTAKPRRLAAPPLPRWGGGSRESTIFRLAVALIALHVVDDNFVQPQPGTSAGDHLVSGLVPLAALGGAALAYPRLRGALRGAMALAFGVLEGWYVPSRNGAAVIAFPGRKGPQRQTRMLARHGYGVLLFDRRGEGRSDGEPNAFGWGGDRDIKAAIAFLQRRSDVDPDRIGGIGLSEDRSASAVPHRRPQQPERGRSQPGVLQGGGRTQDALGDPGIGPRRGAGRAAGGVRTTGDRVLRPGAAAMKPPSLARGAPLFDEALL
jgi:X-Pro dipeptidyl-peptidase-like protein